MNEQNKFSLNTKEKAARAELLNNMLGEDISDNFFIWLTENGFYEMPASAKYHGVHEGGLFDHSFFVTKALVELTENMKLEWQNPRSPYVVGMFHDLCKIDNYTKTLDDTPMASSRLQQLRYIEKMKEQETFPWHWDYSNDKLLEGHAVKSIMLLSAHMQLTEEEMLCIRYHMGAYEKDDWTGFDKAIRKYPNVLYTHMADMLASKVTEHELKLEELGELCERKWR